MPNMMIEIKSRLKGTKLGTYYRRKRWNRAILSRETAAKKVDEFLGKIDDNEKELIINDIIDMAQKHRFSPDEYFYYHFKDMPYEQRATFISDLNRIDFCEKLNKSKNLAIFDDKMRSFEVFKDYYRRDALCVKGEKELSALEKFIDKHSKFILKPLTGTCGKGIQIIDMTQIEDKKSYLKKLINEYCNGFKDGFIVEELIVQVPELAQFHSSSVNSVRIATIRYKEGVEVIAAFFRTGRGGNVVDNAGAGRLFGTIDIQTGTVNAVGDEFGNHYTKHPDSMLEMVGFTIPRWNEAIQMAKELAVIVDGNHYAGWDLALTQNGWVMVEGNARGQFVWQIPLQKGYLKEANEILKRFGKKPLKTHI